MQRLPAELSSVMVDTVCSEAVGLVALLIVVWVTELVMRTVETEVTTEAEEPVVELDWARRTLAPRAAMTRDETFIVMLT